MGPCALLSLPDTFPPTKISNRQDIIILQNLSVLHAPYLIILLQDAAENGLND